MVKDEKVRIQKIRVTDRFRTMMADEITGYYKYRSIIPNICLMRHASMKNEVDRPLNLQMQVRLRLKLVRYFCRTVGMEYA